MCVLWMNVCVVTSDTEGRSSRYYEKLGYASPFGLNKFVAVPEKSLVVHTAEDLGGPTVGA